MTWAEVAQWFDDHGEAVITLIVGALLGMLANWFFYRRAEKPKQLGWELVSGNRIISATEDQRKRLTVAYDGHNVENPYVLVLRIANAGKQEISASDFPEPILIDFGETRVLTIETIGKHNPKVTGSFTVETSKPNLAQFTPQLLNRDEWVEFQFVTDGDPGSPTISARFAGQSAPMTNFEEVRKRRDRRVRTMWIFANTVLAIAFSMAFALGFIKLVGMSGVMAWSLVLFALVLWGVNVVMGLRWARSGKIAHW